MKPRVLCLSSGGSKGLVHLGVLSRFNMNGLLDEIHTYSGTSIGALVCVLLNVGYEPAEVAEMFMEFKLDHQVGMANLIEDFGFFSMTQLKERIEDMIVKKWGFVPTFEQLYQATRKVLFITTYNIDRMEVYHFNYMTEPTCSVSEAVCISMSIPIFFKAYHYKSYRFVDGAVGNSFPVELFDNDNVPILGVVVYSDKQPSQSFTNYVSRLSEGNNKEYIKLKIKSCKENSTIIEVECEDPDFFIVDIEKRADIYSKGWLAADRHMIEPFTVKCEYSKELLHKTSEMCDNFLPFISTMLQKRPDLVLRHISLLPYQNILALYNISHVIKDMTSIREQCMRREEKKTLYHRLSKVLANVLPKGLLQRFSVVESLK